MPTVPPALPPSIQMEQVRAGYVASQSCRAVLDSLDLAMCLNQVGAQQKSEDTTSPSFSVGFSLGTFTLMDGIAVAIERKGLNPNSNLQAKAASDTTLVSALRLEKQGQAAGLDDDGVRQLITHVANISADHWDQWRLKPQPDWLAKQMRK